MIKQFFTGFFTALSGFQHLTTSGIKRYIIIPLLINISLFSGIFWYSYNKISGWIDGIFGWFSLPTWLEWLSYFLWLPFMLVALLIIFYTFTLVANFVGSPFNGFLSEKVEVKMTGHKPPSSGKTSTVISIKNALLSEVQKLGYLLMWIIPLLILTIIPGINIFMPFAWLYFGAWMLSLEYLDYPMGNHGIEFARQREILGQNRALALGFGTCITLITAVPVLNFFAMPVAVIAATRLWVSHINDIDYKQ